MNNKISSLIILVFVFLAFSCKSDTKKEQPAITESTEQAQKVADIEKEYQNETSKDQNQDQKDTDNTAAIKEESAKVDTPKNKKPLRESKAAPHDNSKGDKGIEIEMAHEEEDKKEDIIESEVKENKKEIATIPEKEVETERPDKPEKIEKFVGFPSHSIFDGLLKKHVSASGFVDYKGLKASESTLDKYLAILESNPPGTTWTRDLKLAYWINAYNAYTIKLILNNYPIKSITDISGGKPWDVKWINLDGKSLSLNNIENDIIRPEFNEPRIHFAVNCAAKSCPPLLNAAYTAKTLEAKLESQTKKFINNPDFNKLEKNAIKVSKIFEWYGEDFGDIASFVMRYADKTIKPSAKVTYLEYDWDLNGK